MRGICQRCKKIADLQEHHINKRAHDKKNTVMICFKCHRFLHDNPAQANKEGFMTKLDSTYIKQYSKSRK